MQCQEININLENPTVDVSVDNPTAEINNQSPIINVENQIINVEAEIVRPTIDINLCQQWPAWAWLPWDWLNWQILVKNTDVSWVYEWRKQIDFKSELFEITDANIFEFNLLNTPLEFSESVLINWLEQNISLQYNITWDKLIFLNDIWYRIWDLVKVKYAY